MSSKKQIGQRVDETLNSIDGIRRATANPYLFTRIKARLEKEDGFWSNAISFLRRPVVAVSVIVLAALINGMMFFEFRSEHVTATLQDDEQVFASEYNLVDNAIYDSTIEP
jgi:fumarate reductase subunit C